MQNFNKLISIGVPIFNGGKTILEAIESLLKQDYRNIEIIISDNCSTDNTQEICLLLQKNNPKIKYYRQIKNIGSASNFEFVLNKAEGYYFMWAACDDLWDKMFISTCYEILEQNNNLNFAMTGYKCVSMLTPIFNLNFNSPLNVITRIDNNIRLLEYSKLDYLTHKDNLVYSLWKKKFIKETIYELKTLLNGNLYIGCYMNEYILSSNIGGFSKKVLFYKRYNKFPPGHFIDLLIHSIKNLLKKNQNKYSILKKNMEDLNLILKEKTDQQTLIKIIKINEEAFLKSYKFRLFK